MQAEHATGSTLRVQIYKRALFSSLITVPSSSWVPGPVLDILYAFSVILETTLKDRDYYSHFISVEMGL